jgi:hypothetical protein
MQFVELSAPEFLARSLLIMPVQAREDWSVRCQAAPCQRNDPLVLVVRLDSGQVPSGRHMEYQLASLRHLRAGPGRLFLRLMRDSLKPPN